ncbi:MAG: GNAT family N-acetyltransferase [Actinomycetota bacterium]|nr:GNAT family N-acetyltransferase [Actinomycetota bacterium]
MSNSAVTLRPFADHDVHPALALNNQNMPELNELDAPEVARLAGLAEAALVAEVQGRFAGFCWVIGPGQPYGSLNYGWFSRQYESFLYLDRIAVQPEFRRYGIGRAFYTDLVRRFTDAWPVLTCEVNVRPMNEPSVRFHHTIGFREVGRQDTDGGNKTVSLLALPLRPATAATTEA